jgi:hypothetical protein
MNTAMSVDALVIMTDSGMSPRAMKATMLDAVPPGMQLTSATPMARPGSRPQFLHGM